jgi:hypothetical protein
MKNKKVKETLIPEPLLKDDLNKISFSIEEIDKINGYLDSATGFCEEGIVDEAIAQIRSAQLLLM